MLVETLYRMEQRSRYYISTEFITIGVSVRVPNGVPERCKHANSISNLFLLLK